MTRGGRPRNREDGPERRCIVTGEVQPKSGLIRFVVGPDGELVPDLLEKLPGRGMWVSADRATLEAAVKKNPFSRAARQKVTIPEGMVERIEEGLLRRVTDLLALSRKGGTAVAGYEKVKSWLLQDHARVLLQASDGSERGKSKLRPPSGDNTLIECLTANELGLAFGRENVIHGALAGGGLTVRVVEEASKLRGLRERDGGNARRKGTKTNER